MNICEYSLLGLRMLDPLLMPPLTLTHMSAKSPSNISPNQEKVSHILIMFVMGTRMLKIGCSDSEINQNVMYKSTFLLEHPLGAHAIIQNPSSNPAEKRKKERRKRKNAVNSGPCLPWMKSVNSKLLSLLFTWWHRWNPNLSLRKNAIKD